MLKIRLMRIGDRKRPFYRIVVVDERNKRTGGNIEVVGSYNPLTEPKEIKLNKDRIAHWIKMGAQKSDGFLRILGEAPKRPERKPKKERKQETGDKGQEAGSPPKGEADTKQEEPTVASAPEPTTEQAPAEETPKEESPEATEAKSDADSQLSELPAGGELENQGQTSEGVIKEGDKSSETPIKDESSSEASAKDDQQKTE